MGEENDINKMKVADLREALSKRGLSTEGLKAELINRLQEQLDLEEFGIDAVAVDESKAAVSPVPVSATTAAAIVEELSFKKIVHSAGASEDKIKAVATKEDKKTKPKVTIAAAEVSVAEPISSVVEKHDSVSAAATVPDTVLPAPTAVPESSVTHSKAPKEMTFAEKKASRAARFSLPVVETADTTTIKDDKKVSTSKTEQKKRKSSADKQTSSKQDPVAQTAQTKPAKKVKTQGVSQQPTLPVEEIEKRLKRANKYGISNPTETDALKAMKRAHRFPPQSNDKDEKKSQETKETTTPSQPTLLSKDEIEKRIKRAEKFGTSDPKELDELKAMLRAHRFQKE